MLSNDSAGQQRWIFGSCGLSNAECPRRTGRQTTPSVANTRWLKPESRRFTDLQRATLLYPCSSLCWLLAGNALSLEEAMEAAVLGKEDSKTTKTKPLMLDGASGWMGVWRVQITCEVSGGAHREDGFTSSGRARKQPLGFSSPLLSLVTTVQCL